MTVCPAVPQCAERGIQLYQNIFDTHAHYDSDKFDKDRGEVLAGLPQKGVAGVVNAACDMASCETGLALAKDYPFVFCSVGVHPHSADEYTPECRDRLSRYTREHKVVAIGEIGLDYHYDFSPREVQRRVFADQLALARDLNLPVIIHDREAHGDTMDLLRKYKPKGILHCYSGSAEMAREIISMGMYIAFGGAVTFKNASRLLEAVRAVPLERLLVETDCPYMTPEPFRGKRCDSAMIAYTAERLAELQGTTVQRLLDVTCDNAKAVYEIQTY